MLTKIKKIQTNKCTNINQIVCETGPEYCLVIRFTSNYQNFILENVWIIFGHLFVWNYWVREHSGMFFHICVTLFN